MPAPIPNVTTISRDTLRRLPMHEMWSHIFFYTFQVYILQLPPRRVTPWNEELIDTLMEMHMDNLQYNSNPVPTNINQLLINFALREQWTVAELVWTAIAIRLNSFPILWTAIQECFESAENGDYGWRMPIPINRTIRRVSVIALPTTWF